MEKITEMPVSTFVDHNWALQQLTTEHLAGVPSDYAIPPGGHAIALWDIGIDPKTAKRAILVFIKDRETLVFAVHSERVHFELIDGNPDSIRIQIVTDTLPSGSPSNLRLASLHMEGIADKFRGLLEGASPAPKRITANFYARHAAILQPMVRCAHMEGHKGK